MNLPMEHGGMWLPVALAHVRDGVIGIDGGGKIVWMNPAAERLTGRQGTGATGQGASAVFGSLEREPRAPIGPALESVLNGGAVVHTSRHALFVAGGHSFSVDYVIAPVIQGDGSRGAVIVLSENSPAVADDRAHPESHRGEQEAPLPAGAGRVLVMDDDDVLRNLTVQKLIRLGYESEGASNGDEAVSKYKAARDSGRPFDVVVLDLIIRGGMGGRETLEMLLEVDPGVRAVLTSGHAVDPVLTNFWEYGFFGVIRKPFVIKELDVIIRQALEEE